MPRKPINNRLPFVSGVQIKRADLAPPAPTAPGPSLAADLALALDPDAFAAAAGLEGELDPWQRRLLDAAEDKALLCCSRQAGKSTIAALLACHVAVFEPNSLVLAVSPSQRQSGELYRKIAAAYHALPHKAGIRYETLQRLELENDSRIISLPGSERTTRGFSRVRLVVLDEAARIDDELISSLRPMLATSRGGRFVAMSTAWGRRGWFFDTWHGDAPGWLKLSVTADQVSRISPDFLEEQRRELGPLLFEQEYLCRFVDDAETLFSSEIVEAAFDATIKPLFPVAA